MLEDNRSAMNKITLELYLIELTSVRIEPVLVATLNTQMVPIDMRHHC